MKQNTIEIICILCGFGFDFGCDKFKLIHFKDDEIHVLISVSIIEQITNILK